MVFNLFLSIALAGVPRAPATNGTTVTHSYSTLSLVPWPDPSISQSFQLTYHLLLCHRV